ERLDERPAIAADRRGHVHVVWTDLRAREPDTNIFYARSDDRGTTFSTNRPLDGSRVGFDVDRSSATNQWHPSLAMAHGQLFVAWQDNRLGNDDIFFTTSADGGATFAPAERVDDTGAGASEQTRPHLALGGRRRRRRCARLRGARGGGSGRIHRPHVHPLPRAARLRRALARHPLRPGRAIAVRTRAPRRARPHHAPFRAVAGRPRRPTRMIEL